LKEDEWKRVLTMAEETEPPSRNAATVRIQKSFRGYRARRKLADAATMAKKMGWYVLAPWN
jgi:hypothetical protein